MEQLELFKPKKKKRRYPPKEVKASALRESPVAERMVPSETPGIPAEYGKTRETTNLQYNSKAESEANPQNIDESCQTSRVLKIETHGDASKGLLKSKIRLIGRWLERAGFKPGSQVQVTCLTPGIIELRSSASLLYQRGIGSGEN